ncbi:MAG: glycosyltransferase family 9 protein [Acidobacteriota bacterium]
MGDIRRILILRKSSLGDIIHTLPAFYALRHARPQAEIHWAVEGRGRAIVERARGVDGILDFSLGSMAGARSMRFDMVLDFQGLLKTAVAARVIGGRRVGFDRGYAREPLCHLFYTDRVVPKGVHVIEQNLSLVEAAIGEPVPARDYEFGDLLTSAEVRRVDSDLGRMGIEPGFVLINAGAGWANKRWSPKKFGELARCLSGRQVVVAYGPDDKTTAEAVVEASEGRAMLAFPTTFLEFGALASRSALVVSGDSGPMQLASAVGARVLGLFAPTSPFRNGPWNKGDKYLIGRCRLGEKRQLPVRCTLPAGPVRTAREAGPLSAPSMSAAIVRFVRRELFFPPRDSLCHDFFCYRRQCAGRNCIDKIEVADAVETAMEMLGRCNA